MKKSILLSLAFLFSVIAFAQVDNRVTIGIIDTVQSTLLNEKRKILVYVPNSGSGPAQSQPKYPVVYLLDGDAHFNSVASMIQALSQVNGNTVCPQMIVVGISNTDRTRDLTPTKTGDDPFLNYTSAAGRTASSGGGETFMAFMEKELIPYIDSNYPTQPFKILIGHSFGGLTVMNAVINHTKLFNTYIAIDPSMWWDDLNFLKATKKAMEEKDFSGTTLYVAIANTMDEGMNIRKVIKDTTLNTRGIRAALETNDFIKTRKPKGLKYASKYYENDSHGSVPLIATYDALRFIFADFSFKLENKDVLDPTVDLAGKFQRRYQKISQIYGYEVKPPEAEINMFGYRFLQRKQYQKSEGFFKLNLLNYPESFNVYDSYGDFFVAVGEKAKAIEKYRKALTIKENEGTRKKLNGVLE